MTYLHTTSRFACVAYARLDFLSQSRIAFLQCRHLLHSPEYRAAGFSGRMALTRLTLGIRGDPGFSDSTVDSMLRSDDPRLEDQNWHAR